MRNTGIGFLATSLSAISLLPMVFNTAVKKNTYSINYFYVLIAFIAQIVWFTYGFVNKDTPLIILSLYLLFVFTIVGFSKWYYERTEQDVHSKMLNHCKKIL